MQNKILVVPDELNTKAKILFVAKEEFLKKGFSGTSVRAIAEKAELTTGALYNLFKNKDSIFTALVEKAFEDFLRILAHHAEPDYDMKTTDLAVIRTESNKRFLKFVDFFYDNWDTMKLLVCHSKGSSYEHIFDKAIDYMEKQTVEWLKRDNIRVSKRQRFFIHVMVSSHMENLKEIFQHDLKKQEAAQYAIDISDYHCAGWKQYWELQEEE
ncbi:TetR/AcrR family transcriptional regulator [Treponema phagedenis]|uniref:TetR/AcrR family transcriptional regulator n=1 Tax=Treponema phagedenis TaxID=162 RepID=UPI0001F637FE|nr:TetR/AcrR family transcriptional regulator [Treponema phagedenis]EFW36799.1 transcriptional regulator, TetR family [Treponema phagedenis F0421]TYT78597.1 TetR/AcrR family transcriptional regulator [Treponema phagedenis]